MVEDLEVESCGSIQNKNGLKSENKSNVSNVRRDSDLQSALSEMPSPFNGDLDADAS